MKAKVGITRLLIAVGLAGSFAAFASPVTGCKGLDDGTFTSVNEYEVGETPHGVAMGNWKVSFERDAVKYRYSDISSSGTFNCDPKEGEITSSLLNGKAYYFASRGVLLWGGKWYVKAYVPFPLPSTLHPTSPIVR